MSASKTPLASVRIASWVFGFLIILITSSCGGFGSQGSGNIFDDPPDCFYDVVFGCGTFDIPGDSSYYGYRSFTRKALVNAAKSTNSIPNFSGNWNGVLSRKSSSCDFTTPLKFHGSFSVLQTKNRATVKLPVAALSRYTLRGKADNKGIQASTFGLLSFCGFRASSNLKSSNTRSGNLDVDVKINCPFQTRCEISYSGSVKK